MRGHIRCDPQRGCAVFGLKLAITCCYHLLYGCALFAVFVLVGGLFCPAPPKGVNRIYPPTSLIMTLPICPRYPYGIQMVSIGYLYGMCRSYFDSKAVYFAIRPMCRKRGLRASGGECGPVCAIWCFFIEQAGVEEPIPFFLPGKKKKPGSSSPPGHMYSTLLPTPAPRLPPFGH